MIFEERLAVWRESLGIDWIAALEARRFVEMMQAEHPDELHEWIKQKTVQFVTETLGRQERAQRARVLKEAGARSFFEANDDPEALELFRHPFVVDAENHRLPLAEMTAGDCFFVATRYESRGNQELMMAAFFKALAKRVGNDTVGSVMTEEECARLLGSFTNPRRLPAVA